MIEILRKAQITTEEKIFYMIKGASLGGCLEFKETVTDDDGRRYYLYTDDLDSVVFAVPSGLANIVEDERIERLCNDRNLLPSSLNGARATLIKFEEKEETETMYEKMLEEQMIAYYEEEALGIPDDDHLTPEPGTVEFDCDQM